MYRVIISDQARQDYVFFLQGGNKSLIKKISKLLSDMVNHPYDGIGKPEALKYDLSGKWSRRINREHRLVYSVSEKENLIYVYSMRFHY